MAARKKTQRVGKRRPSRAAPKRKATPRKRSRKLQLEAEEPDLDLAIGPETVGESLLHIAQDAVVILRRELAWKARLAEVRPGLMNMSDCIALLKLMAELGEAAKRGDEGGAEANYDRLTAEEKQQLAALLLKVDYT